MIQKWLVMWQDSKIGGIIYNKQLLYIISMNSWNKLIFCMLIQIHKNWKQIKNLLGGHGQKWVRPVWSWDSKIDSISKLNRWNNLIFCMLVQMQEGWKLIQSFLSVPCQKWQWLFSSWDPKTCIVKMSIYRELIILCW